MSSDDEWSPDDTPPVEGYETVTSEPSIPPMVGVGVPAVVAVIVSRNPGPWLETALASIESQDYANLTTLVVDAGSVTDPTTRVAESMPTAFVKQIRSGSFAEGANAALGSIEGASFYLFCHDDIELQPGAVQALVEEAFRSNAGIVGAKLVDWDDPEHLRNVGGTIDKFGFVWPVAEPNELDQSQHDAVRDVMVVSSAAMLVRCDLFADIGGFSTDIDGWGEELDLCCRACVAGARTVVMPGAVVRHRERAEIGDSSGRSAHVALRHQARIMLVCSGGVRLARILPQALILAVLDLVVSVVRGHFGAARDVGSAVTWNIAHLPRTYGIRRRTQRARRTPDSEIARLQVPGSVRVSTFVRRYTSSDRSVAATLAAAARGLPRSADADDREGLWAIGAFLVAGFVLLVGSRGLIASGVPAVREFVPGGNAASLFAEWWSGWRSGGLGAASGAPTIDLVEAVLDRLTFGSSGFVRTALILAPLPLGAASAWRLLRGAASPGARVAALAAFLVNPLPYNCIAEGRWQALVVYSAAPALLGRIARAGGWAPFDTALPAPGSVQRQVVGLGLVLAAATTIAPVTALVTVILAVVIIAVMRLTGREGSPARAAMVTGGALLLSALLHLPWTLAVLGGSNRWAVLVGAEPSRRAPLSLGRALLFDTGVHGGWLSVGLLVATAVAAVISVGPRFAWAAVSLALVVVSAGLVVVAGRLAPGVALPGPEVLLVFAAIATVVSIGIGVDAFRVDVVGSAFGVRQVLSLVAVAAVLTASLPLVQDFLAGRWLAPSSDVDTALAPIRSPRTVPGERTLWIGDGDVISTQGWSLGDGTKFALTDGERASFSDLFPAAPGVGERRLRSLLEGVTRDGDHVGRLGAALAPFGIHYLVVARRLAPLPYGRTDYPLAAGLEEQLNQQFDLIQVDVAPGIAVFENLAALPVRFTAQPAGDGSLDITAPVATRPAVTAWPAAGRPPTRFTGTLPADRSLVTLSTLDDGWRLQVGGRSVAPKAVAGWSARYDVGRGGPATLRYSTPTSQLLLHLVQLLVFVSLPWLRRRRVSEFRVRSTRSRAHEPEVES